MEHTVMPAFQSVRFTTSLSNRMFALHQQTPEPYATAFSRTPVEYRRIVTIIASNRFSLSWDKSLPAKPISFALSTITSVIFINPLTYPSLVRRDSPYGFQEQDELVAMPAGLLLRTAMPGRFVI